MRLEPRHYLTLAECVDVACRALLRLHKSLDGDDGAMPSRAEVLALGTAIYKAHVKGHYRTVNGKRVWVKEHDDKRQHAMDFGDGPAAPALPAAQAPAPASPAGGDSPFGDVIYSYTRKDALEDGQQVQCPEGIAREAGFKWPVFITRAVWDAYVEVPAKVEAQDREGRLWDVLYMAANAARKGGGGGGAKEFIVYVRNDNRRPKPVKLYMQAGPTDHDDPAPAITIMTSEDL